MIASMVPTHPFRSQVWPAAVANHAELLDAACQGADAPELKVRLAAVSNTGRAAMAQHVV